MRHGVSKFLGALAAGAVLWAAPALAGGDDAHAGCPHHRAGAAATKPADRAAAQQQAEPAATQPERHADKCKCGSKADCTCKKGQCQCAACGKRREALEALTAAPTAVPSRADASAGMRL